MPPMKVLPWLMPLLIFCACGKDKPKPVPVAAVDALAAPVLKQDDELAAKLAAAYGKIHCALAVGISATDALYTDAGFADGPEYFRAFQVQAAANPAWARKVSTDALVRPCLEARPAAAQPAEPPPVEGAP